MKTFIDLMLVIVMLRNRHDEVYVIKAYIPGATAVRLCISGALLHGGLNDF